MINMQRELGKTEGELGKTEAELAALKASKPRSFGARLLGGE